MIKTPITDEAARRAVEKLQSCKSADDFNKAVKDILCDFIATSKRLETDLAEARDMSWLDEALNSGDGTYKP